jgi:Kef-type K+ transport system membrane component KefB
LSLLLIVTLEFLADHLGLDVLLGSFAAGMIVRVAVAGRDEQEQVAIFRGKLEAVGFGFLVPVFFIVSGMALDLRTFGRHPAALALIPAYFLLLLVVRGLPTMWAYRRELPQRPRTALALMASTGLPLMVVITTIGQADGYISSQNAAALVTAGMLSVLLLPAISLRIALGQPPRPQRSRLPLRGKTA